MLSSMSYIERARAWCPSVPHPQASPSLFGLSISLEWIGIYLKPKDMWYEKKREGSSQIFIFLYILCKQAKVCDDENIRGHFCFSFFFFCCPWIVLRLISLYKCNMTHMEKKNMNTTLQSLFFFHPLVVRPSFDIDALPSHPTHFPYLTGIFPVPAIFLFCTLQNIFFLLHLLLHFHSLSPVLLYVCSIVKADLPVFIINALLHSLERGKKKER